MKDWRSTFSIPIYDHKMTIVVTEDMKAWTDKFPETDAAAPEGECMAMFAAYPAKHEYIIIQPNSPLHHLAHEIGHAARYIMGYIGFKIIADNDEPIAYLEDFLHREINARISKIPEKKA